MSSTGQIKSNFSDDILEFIRLLEKYEVRYVIVGGEAVVFHGYPRLTGAIDFFYDCTESNLLRLFHCLAEFWEGKIPGVTRTADLMEAGMITQFGRPPHRLDLLNRIDAVPFSEAWDSRIIIKLREADASSTVYYLGKEALLKNKKASARLKNLDDVLHLE